MLNRFFTSFKAMGLVLLAFIFLIRPESAWATHVGVGTLVTNFLSAQTSADGGRRTFQVAPTLLVGGELPIYGQTFFTPRIGYSMYLDEKDDTSKTDMMLNYHVGTKLMEYFMLHYGFSTFITKIKGKGGTKELQNGGSTANFYIPDKTVTSYTASLDVGGQVLIHEHWSARVDLFITRFLSSDRRKLNYLLSGNFYF